MDRYLPYIYAAAGAALLLSLLNIIHVKLHADAHVDLLNVTADFCVSVFKTLTVYCGTFTVEGGCPVLYNKKGVPTYMPINLKKIKNVHLEDIAEAVDIPYVKRLRLYKVSIGAKFGAADACKSVMVAQGAALLCGVLFTYLHNRDFHTVFERRIVPEFAGHAVKISLNCIIGMSLANIILSVVQTLYHHLRRRIHERAALKACMADDKCRVKL